MDIVDRIQHLVDGKHISIAALERELGLSNGIIKKWKKQSPSCDKIIAIANYLNVTTDYLLLGRRDSSSLSEDELELICTFNSLNDIDKAKIFERAMTLFDIELENDKLKRSSQKSLSISTRKTENSIVVPLCELPVSAGTGIYLDGGSTEPLKVDRTAASEAANYALRVSGDSMEPEYSDGDIVLIETVEDISEGEIGIFIADGEGFMKIRGAEALISLNATYPPRSYASFESVKCIGRVLGKAELV